MIISFTDLNRAQREMILDWRNSNFVRSNMKHQKKISQEDHSYFIGKLKNDKENKYFLVIDNYKYIGVVYLNNISNCSAEIGLYKNPRIRGKSLGNILLNEIFNYAKQIDLKKLTLRVKSTNKRAITLYKKNGFSVHHIENDYIFMELKISNHVFIIGELSCNHGNDIELARKTIKSISESGADAVKIQTYTAESHTIDCNNQYFRINQGTLWDGQTLYDLYKSSYTPWEWHKELQEFAEDLGLTFFSSPSDLASVDFLESMHNPIYKIASFEITDLPLIKYVASTGKPIIISTGIALEKEIFEAIGACRSVGNNDISILKCTSSYPAPVDQANLNTMVDMRNKFNVKVGLSDHSLGSDVAIAAVSLGATIVEKHVILDRDLGGPDAPFSMEPHEFKNMVNSIRNVEKALGRVDYELSNQSLKNRNFSRSLFFVENINKGEHITKKNMRSIRPGFGISPKYIDEIIGRTVVCDIKKGTPVSWDLISDKK